MTNTRLSIFKEKYPLYLTNKQNFKGLEKDRIDCISETILDAVSNRWEAAFLLKSLQPLVKLESKKKNEQESSFIFIYNVLTTANINDIDQTQLDSSILEISNQIKIEIDLTRKEKLKNLVRSLEIIKLAISYKKAAEPEVNLKKKRLELALMKDGNFIFVNLSGAYLKDLTFKEFDFSGLFLTGANFDECILVNCPANLFICLYGHSLTLKEVFYFPTNSQKKLEKYLDQRIINSTLNLFFNNIKQNAPIENRVKNYIDDFNEKVSKNPFFSLGYTKSSFYNLFIELETGDELKNDEHGCVAHINKFFLHLDKLSENKKSNNLNQFEEVIKLHKNKIHNLKKVKENCLKESVEFNIKLFKNILAYKPNLSDIRVNYFAHQIYLELIENNIQEAVYGAIKKFEFEPSINSIIDVYTIVIKLNIMTNEVIDLLRKSNYYSFLVIGINEFEKENPELNEDEKIILNDIISRVTQLDCPIQESKEEQKNEETQQVKLYDSNQSKIPEYKFIEDADFLVPNHPKLTEENLSIIQDFVLNQSKQESIKNNLNLSTVASEESFLVLNEEHLENKSKKEVLELPLVTTKKGNFTDLNVESLHEIVEDNQFYEVSNTTYNEIQEFIFSIPEDFKDPLLKNIINQLMGSQFDAAYKKSKNENDRTIDFIKKTQFLDEIEYYFLNSKQPNSHIKNENLYLFINLAQVIFSEYHYQGVLEARQKIFYTNKKEKAEDEFDAKYEERIHIYLIAILDLIDGKIRLELNETNSSKLVCLLLIAHRVLLNIFYRIKEQKGKFSTEIRNKIIGSFDKIIKNIILPLSKNTLSNSAIFPIQHILYDHFVFNQNENRDFCNNIKEIYFSLKDISRDKTEESHSAHLWFLWSGLSYLCDEIKAKNHIFKIDHLNKQLRSKKGSNKKKQNQPRNDNLKINDLFYKNSKKEITNWISILDGASESLSFLKSTAKDKKDLLFYSSLPTPLTFLESGFKQLPSIEQIKRTPISCMGKLELKELEEVLTQYRYFLTLLKNMFLCLIEQPAYFMKNKHPSDFLKIFLANTIEINLAIINDELQEIKKQNTLIDKNTLEKEAIAEKNSQELIQIYKKSRKKNLKKEHMEKNKNLPESKKSKPNQCTNETSNQAEDDFENPGQLPKSIQADDTAKKILESALKSNFENDYDAAINHFKKLKGFGGIYELQALEGILSAEIKVLLLKIDQELALSKNLRDQNRIDKCENEFARLEKKYNDFEKKVRGFKNDVNTVAEYQSSNYEINVSPTYMKHDIEQVSRNLKNLLNRKEINYPIKEVLTKEKDAPPSLFRTRLDFKDETSASSQEILPKAPTILSSSETGSLLSSKMSMTSNLNSDEKNHSPSSTKIKSANKKYSLKDDHFPSLLGGQINSTLTTQKKISTSYLVDFPASQSLSKLNSFFTSSPTIARFEDKANIHKKIPNIKKSGSQNTKKIEKLNKESDQKTKNFINQITNLKSLDEVLEFIIQKNNFTKIEIDIFNKFIINKFSNDYLFQFSSLSYNFLCTKLIGNNLFDQICLLKDLGILDVLLRDSREKNDSQISFQEEDLQFFKKMEDQISSAKLKEINQDIILSHILSKILTKIFPAQYLKINLSYFSNEEFPLYKVFYKLNLTTDCQAHLHALLSNGCIEANNIRYILPPNILKLREHIINHNKKLLNEANIHTKPYYLYLYGSNAIYQLYGKSSKSSDMDYSTNVPEKELEQLFSIKKIEKLTEADVYQFVNESNQINYSMSIKVDRVSLFEEIQALDFTIHQIMLSCLSFEFIYFSELSIDSKNKFEIKSIFKISNLINHPQKLLRMIIVNSNYSKIRFKMNSLDLFDLNKFISDSILSTKENGLNFLNPIMKEKSRLEFFWFKLISGNSASYISSAITLNVIGFILPIPLVALPISNLCKDNIITALSSIDSLNKSAKRNPINQLTEIISTILFHIISVINDQKGELHQLILEKISDYFSNLGLINAIKNKVSSLLNWHKRTSKNFRNESFFKPILEKELIVYLVPGTFNQNQFQEGSNLFYVINSKQGKIVINNHSQTILSSLQATKLMALIEKEGISIESNDQVIPLKGELALKIRTLIYEDFPELSVNSVQGQFKAPIKKTS